MRRPAATIAAKAAMLLAAVPRALASVPEPSIGRLCAAHSVSLPLPLPTRGDRRDHPDACHAACTRSSRGDCEEDGGD